MRHVLFVCLLAASAMFIAGTAAATPQFDVVVTQINGSPVAPTQNPVLSGSDIIRVQLQLTIEPGDNVQSATIGMQFDPAGLVLAGPSPGPFTFHQPCDISGSPCSLFPGADSSSGSGTTDNQPFGLVGSMGATSFAGSLGTGTHALGVVDFHVRDLVSVVAYVRFPGIEGTFTNFGNTPVPFTIGPGISAVPEPSTALLVGLGFAAMAGIRRRA